MKELSIEQKAKAYDKVLDAVKNLREANPSDEGIQNWVNENFPELKESEDERIKKALLKMTNDTPRDIIWNNYGVHKEDAIAWFEKQCEQKPAESRQEIKLNGGIVYEDFNDGDGHYKVNLGYLSKPQVELIENLVASWQNLVDKAVIKPNPQTNFPEFIDLGLPSGILWADRNLGANTPEESGDYYRFGETVPFTKNSPEYVYDDIKGSIAGTDKDVATKLLGKEYSMPTLEQINELIDECEWEWIEEDGIKGMKVTGSNGNSIFLPACGSCLCSNGTFCNIGSNGDFWSASVSVSDIKYGRGLYFYLDNWYCSICDRASGFPIRAVHKVSPIDKD